MTRTSPSDPLRRIVTLAAAMLVLIGSTPAGADPCGMVPPIYLGQPRAITRIGLQKTYCFYKNGIETLVIRPGFTGNVEEFGMLIPFPSPPAIRKVSDHIFEHVAAAIDPPEVVVDLRPNRNYFGGLGGGAGFGGGDGFGDDGGLDILRANQTRVIREEAVGMYDVVVLEAGSALALKKWMDEHGYRYPTGMDTACEDYVLAGWCFVAVRTRINEKRGVDPRPGQTDVATGLGANASFGGHVQAMGFRFRSDSLVVPMRLSTFNEGDLHNVVYLLTDRPQRINSIPERFVVRQVSGRELYRNLTELLPVRLIGGTVANLTSGHHDWLLAQRDPLPVNGAARDLFAGDLLCAREGKLENPHEAMEKTLLRIGERLNLRGEALDQLNLEALDDERQGIVESALEDLYSMTLTVIDGDFPREVLAGDNLTFSKFVMSEDQNRPSAYNARLFTPNKPEGQLIRGPIRRADGTRAPGPPSRRSQTGGIFESSIRPAKTRTFNGLAVLAIVAVLGIAVGRTRRWPRGTRAVVFLVAIGCGSFAAWAQTSQRPVPMRQLVRQWDDPESVDQAVEKMIQYQEKALNALAHQVADGETLARRGWAIVCLSEISGSRADRMLRSYENDEDLPQLVRTWASAARIRHASSLNELLSFIRERSDPALVRPLEMRARQLLADGASASDVENLLRLSISHPNMNPMLAPLVAVHNPDDLCQVMIGSDDGTVRRQAAAFLATQAVGGSDRVAKRVIKALAFDPLADHVPWRGGPLFLPGLAWSADSAVDLLGELVAWRIWCEKRGQQAVINQLDNNLRNVAQFAGVSPTTWDSRGWFRAWASKAGSERWIRALEQLDYAIDPDTEAYLKSINEILETTYLKSDGAWTQVGILDREGERARVLYIQPREPAVQWVAGSDLVAILDKDQAVAKASVDGKYRTLLHTIPAATDLQSYGEFQDYGRWTGTSYRSRNDLSPGFWVYVFPNWYIWKEQVADKE